MKVIFLRALHSLRSLQPFSALLALLIVIAGILSPGISGICAGQDGPPSLLVLLIPGLQWQDFSQCPALDELSATGAVGLMNASGGNRLLTSSYLSLSSGQKAVCPEKAGELCLQREETISGITAAAIYERYLGITADDAQIVIPYINSIKTANAAGGKPGLLADTLSEHEIQLLYMGNQDLPGIPARPGALVAMDGTGRIREGSADQRSCLVSSYSPTHFTTNYPFLYENTAAFFRDKTGLVILDLGDLARLDKIYDSLAPAVYSESRKRLLSEIDSFVSGLVALARENNAALLIVAPYPDKNSLQQGNMLTPVLFSPPGSGESLLTSASTKRPGIITNLDIAPTIVNFFGIPPATIYIGAPLITVPYPGARAFLENMHQLILANYVQRPYLLKSYVIMQIVVVLSVLLLLILRHPLLRRVYPFVLILPAGPLLFLLLPLVPTTDFVTRTITLLVASLLLAAVIIKQHDIKKYLAALYLLTAVIIACDLLLDAPLMKLSLLGYDPISGARYYGLGNEYMGVLLGSGLLGLTLLAEILNKSGVPRVSRYRFIVMTVFAGLVLLVALPRWGTNVGGAIAFLSSLVILGLSLYKVRLHFKTAVFIFLGFLLLFSLLFYFDMQHPLQAQTHIGLTARLIREEGAASLLPIFSRKIAMNIKLIQYSLWTRVFLTFLAATVFMFLRPPGQMKKIFADYPYLQAGSIAGIGGSLIALAVNDSGIVAAATTMIFVVPVLFYLVMERTPTLRE